jgi:epoxyqueuosine reductase QueG
MELNNLDIKSYRNDDKKENLNIIKSDDAVKNNKNQSKDKDRKVELNRISNLNVNDNISKQIKEGDNLLNKLNNVQVNYVNKYNLNYDYNKLVNNNLNDKKDQLSSRNEKEKILHLIIMRDMI